MPYLAYASLPTIRFPTTIVIPDGMKVHFGSQWVSTSGTAMHIQQFYESNWLNYTVDGVGKQIIGSNNTQPSTIIIDGITKTATNYWNATDSTTVILDATNQVQIFFEASISISSAFALAALALIIALSAFGAIFLVRRRRD